MSKVQYKMPMKTRLYMLLLGEVSHATGIQSYTFKQQLVKVMNGKITAKQQQENQLHRKIKDIVRYYEVSYEDGIEENEGAEDCKEDEEEIQYEEMHVLPATLNWMMETWPEMLSFTEKSKEPTHQLNAVAIMPCGAIVMAAAEAATINQPN